VLVSPKQQDSIRFSEKLECISAGFQSIHERLPYFYRRFWLVIEVKDVYFTYPSNVEALEGVSLTIRSGDFVAIMGQNGAGKTTLVKHFNGLLKPTKGCCETVEDEVAFALRNFGFEKKAIRKRVEWAINLLGLTRYRQSSPFMLSGGERKRVALASVLAWDPDVVILDEPTIGQDYEQKEKLRQFIVQLNAQGKTVIIVTHDVEFVAECNPRVVLMAQGKIVAEGDGKHILTDRKLVAEASIVPPQISQIFMGLSDFGLPTDVIDVYEARDILLDFLEGVS